MVRALVGYAVLAIVGIIAIKLLLAAVGIVWQLAWAVLWLALLGFIFYLILKVISPKTARKVKDAVRGEQSQ
ncbi:MAG: hypothetical protein V3T74_10585 [Gemmatimonadales bacterium]|jgi:hypothetical protein